MQCRGSRRAFTTAGEESGLMPGYGMKRGSGQFFSLSHMHYVGRSFRLLNPSYVRPCAFGAFFRQKISPYGNFLPETEGKTRSPAGTDEL